MSSGESGRVIASAFALAGFAVAMVAGTAVGNPAGGVIKVGLVAMVVCYLAGSIIGSIAQSVVSAHLDSLRDGAAGSVDAARGVVEIGGSVETTS